MQLQFSVFNFPALSREVNRGLVASVVEINYDLIYK